MVVHLLSSLACLRPWVRSLALGGKEAVEGSKSKKREMPRCRVLRCFGKTFDKGHREPQVEVLDSSVTVANNACLSGFLVSSGAAVFCG